jgi:hypothetical protein
MLLSMDNTTPPRIARESNEPEYSEMNSNFNI